MRPRAVAVTGRRALQRSCRRATVAGHLMVSAGSAAHDRTKRSRPSAHRALTERSHSHTLARPRPRRAGGSHDAGRRAPSLAAIELEIVVRRSARIGPQSARRREDFARSARRGVRRRRGREIALAQLLAQLLRRPASHRVAILASRLGSIVDCIIRSSACICAHKSASDLAVKKASEIPGSSQGR